MRVGVVKESFPGERRVALVPGVVAGLARDGMDVALEAGAGVEAGFPDELYSEKGATIVADRGEVLSTAEVLCQVRTLGANPDAGRADLERLRRDQVVIGLAEPLSELDPIRSMADAGITCFALELIPRITRAQSMDVLSSQATVAGYEAVLLGAKALPKMMPMMMTAAGTLAPAKILVIGAGVAGLQAIATSRRLGAVVSGYDVRPAVKEQVESLGANFVELELESTGGEDRGGYAKAMDDTFYQRQQELMTQVVAESDLVITTAAVPGKKAPVLVTEDMVRGMHAGAVIVDLAAERGGNCELTRADETVLAHGVTIIGPTNLPTEAPYHASQMFARNTAALLTHLVKDGRLEIDLDDEITEGTLLTREGRIVQRRVREIMGLDVEDADASTDPATKPSGGNPG